MARRKKQRRWIKGLIFLVLVIAAGVICYLVWDSYFREKPAKPAEESSKVEEKKKEEKPQEKEEPVPEPSTVEEKDISNYDGDNPNDRSDLTGVITYAGVSGDFLLIRVNIDQFLNDGTCSLNLIEDGGVVYGDEVGIVSSAATATCEGFNVPVAQIGSGNFGISIKLNAGDKVGEINGEVSL